MSALATTRARLPFPLLVPAVVVAAAALLPVAYLVIRSTQGGLETVIEVLGREHTRDLLWRSIALTTTVTIGATVLGVALAWFTTRVRLPFPRIWPVLAALPLAVPTYVAALTWVSTFSDFDGFGASALLMTLYCYPYVYLPVVAALSRLDPAQEDVARSLGRTTLQTFFWVTVPQLRHAATAGALLVALYALSEFGAVSMLRYDTLTLGVFQSYNGGFDRTPAAILGSLLVMLALIVIVAEIVTRGKAAQHSVGSNPARKPQRNVQPSAVLVGTSLSVIVAVMTLVMPATVLGSWIINGASGVDGGELWHAVVGSITAAGAGAVVTVLAALPVALLAARHRSKVSVVIERLSYVGHALPGLVIALALVFFAARYLPAFYQELPALVFAYVVLFVPLAVGAIYVSAVQSPPMLEDVARSLGRSPMRVLASVTVPLTAPGVAAAAALVFLTCMKELPATLLLRPTDVDTLATRVWAETSVSAYAAAAPAAALLIIVSAVPTYLLATHRWTRT